MGRPRMLAWRSVLAPLFAVFLLTACAGGPGSTSARAVAFDDIASAATSRHEGGPDLIVGTSDSARARIASLRPGLTPPEGVGLVAVFQGQQRTGGFAIRVTRIERDGDRLVVRAIFASPLPNAIVSQALSSPVHIVSISASALSGVREAVLLDDTGAERARAGLT
jgi:protease stability complex PrcB-like protein